MARASAWPAIPNFDASKTTAAYQGFAADAFSKERAARWADPAGGYIHAMHSRPLGRLPLPHHRQKPDGTVAYEGGWQNNRQMGMHKDFRMVENIFEELDAPGEWFHDAKSGTLYFMPEPGTDLPNASVEVVRLRHLVEFQGTAASPGQTHHPQGLHLPPRRPHLHGHQGAAAALRLDHLPRRRRPAHRHRGYRASSTASSTSPAAMPSSSTTTTAACLINGCHIHDAGASGVCFVGDPAAVRNPLFEYAQAQDLAKIDRTPGPKTDNYPADSAVEDCLIHGIGRVERQPAGVQISMACRITVRDTSIYDCARAGINISEGTWGGHLIERCDVFDTVLETHDHGSFNSWGRDRYWTSNHRGVSEPEVKKDPKLPFLDAIETTVIRDSRWRCDHGWDIDLDDGSSQLRDLQQPAARRRPQIPRGLRPQGL